MTTEDEIRRVLHPEAHEPMRYNPRIPLGCDQQGRYPQAAEPCVDLDELGIKLPPPEPWWHDWLLVAIGVLLVLAIFVPLGV
jgi:hypothetical protein